MFKYFKTLNIIDNSRLVFEKEYSEHIIYFLKNTIFQNCIDIYKYILTKKTSKSVLTLLSGIVYFFTSLK